MNLLLRRPHWLPSLHPLCPAADDARRLQLEDPNWRSGGELSEIREFKEAAAESLRSPNHTVRTAQRCLSASSLLSPPLPHSTDLSLLLPTIARSS